MITAGSLQDQLKRRSDSTAGWCRGGCSMSLRLRTPACWYICARMPMQILTVYASGRLPEGSDSLPGSGPDSNSSLGLRDMQTNDAPGRRTRHTSRSSLAPARPPCVRTPRFTNQHFIRFPKPCTLIARPAHALNPSTIEPVETPISSARSVQEPGCPQGNPAPCAPKTHL